MNTTAHPYAAPITDARQNWANRDMRNWADNNAARMGSFDVALFELISTADRANQDKLAKVYPYQVAAFRAYQDGSL